MPGQALSALRWAALPCTLRALPLSHAPEDTRAPGGLSACTWGTAVHLGTVSAFFSSLILCLLDATKQGPQSGAQGHAAYTHACTHAWAHV